MTNVSFFGLLESAFKIFAKHWLKFLIYTVIAGLIAIGLTSLIVLVGISATFGGSPMIFAAILGIISAIVMIIFYAAVTLGALKLFIDATKRETISIKDALTYTQKNVFAFIWSVITGIVYAMKWWLLLMVGIPVVWGMTKTMVSDDLGQQAAAAYGQHTVVADTTSLTGMVGGITSSILLILGIMVVVYAIYIGVRMLFLGITFVEENKRGVEAAKASMDLVTGRWWKTFGYIFGSAIIFGIGLAIIQGIISSIIPVHELTQLTSVILRSIVTTVSGIFTVLLYRSYKK